MNAFEAAARELERLDPEYQALCARVLAQMEADGSMQWLKERFPELRRTNVVTQPMVEALIAKLEDELGPEVVEELRQKMQRAMSSQTRPSPPRR
jgi:hypothetical protein